MTREGDDLIDRMRGAATQAVREQARLWRAWTDSWTDAPSAGSHGRDVHGPRRVGGVSSRAVEPALTAMEHTAHFARAYVDATTAYYEKLLDLSQRYAEAVTRDVLAMGSTRRTHPAASEPPPRVDLQGRVGEEAAASLFVDNHRAGSLAVDLRVSPFSPSDGGAPFDGHLTVDPGRFTLASGAERQVALRLRLDGRLFLAGHEYTATMTNSDDEDTRIVLRVSVLPESSASTGP